MNRMNAGNLAICFGCVSIIPAICCRNLEDINLLTMPRRPTLMGSNTGPDIADAGWQVRVVDTILQNTYQIFDED